MGPDLQAACSRLQLRADLIHHRVTNKTKGRAEALRRMAQSHLRGLDLEYPGDKQGERPLGARKQSVFRGPGHRSGQAPPQEDREKL